MKKSIRVLLLLGPILGIVAGVFIERSLLDHKVATNHRDVTVSESALEHATRHLDPTYVCPMHSQIISDHEGSCPICGMDLVAVKQSDPSADKTDEHPVVEVSPSIINSLGVRTVKLERKSLTRRVETPGFVQQIKKGRLTTYRAPFNGEVLELMLEQNRWYENPGEPLIRLKSEELLDAQQQHLTIFAKADADSKQLVVVKETQEEVESQTTAETESYLDENGKLTAIYREQLLAMGQTEESIEAIEKEMQSMPDSIINKNKVAQATTETPAIINLIDTDGELTLADSRSKLRRYGMRDEAIAELETNGDANGEVVLYTNNEGRVMSLQTQKGYVFKSGDAFFRFGGEVRAVVVANAFQRDASWIATGQRADVRLPHISGSVWPGIVNQGAISINPDSQNIGIKLTFTAPLDKVRSNMYVVATIFGDTQENVIAVPTQSIIRTEGEDRIIKSLGNGRFKPVTVKLGVEAGDETEVIEGLEEGDEIVVMAHFLIDSESSLQASLMRLDSF